MCNYTEGGSKSYRKSHGCPCFLAFCALVHTHRLCCMHNARKGECMHHHFNMLSHYNQHNSTSFYLKSSSIYPIPQIGMFVLNHISYFELKSNKMNFVEYCNYLQGLLILQSMCTYKRLK